MHEAHYKQCARTDYGDVPCANKLDVPHQVLPGQKALHITMQSLPQNRRLLETSVQTKRAQKYTISVEILKIQHFFILVRLVIFIFTEKCLLYTVVINK